MKNFKGIKRKQNKSKNKARNKNYAERQRKPEELENLTDIQKFIISVT